MRTLRVCFCLVAVVLLAAAPVGAITEIFGDDLPVWLVGPTIDSDAHQPAMAYDASRDRYLVAWSQDEGDAGFRVRHGVVDAATSAGLLAPTVDLDDPVGQSRQVSCAWDPVSDLYLIVWSQDAPTAGAFEIYGRYVDATNTAVGPAFAISDAGADPTDGSFDAVDPDVAATGQGTFLVAWTMDDDQIGYGEGNFEIFTRRLPAGSTAPSSPTNLVSNASLGGTLLRDALAPAIAYYPDVDQFGMIYELDTDTSVAHHPTVTFIVLEGDGSSPPPLKGSVGREPITGSGGLNKAGLPLYFKKPDIAFDRRERRFLAVWETNVSGEPRIAGRTVNGDYSFGPGPLDFSIESTGGSSVCIARDATVTYSFPTGRYLVGWSGSPTSSAACPNTREILVREVERDGFPVAAQPTVITFMADDGTPSPTAVSPVLIASEAGHRGLFALWSSDSPTRGGFDIFGQFLTMDVATATDEAPTLHALRLVAVPNPFNPSTTLHYALPHEGAVRLDIYDVRGQKVRTLVDADQDAGAHRVVWSGSDDRGHAVASGVYIVRLRHPEGTRTQKVALVE